jgi:hypothetical protein
MRYFLIVLNVLILIPKQKNKNMNPKIISWVILLLVVTIIPLITALISYYAQKKKIAAETERIKLKNRIDKTLTVEKLAEENKQMKLQNKLDTFKQILALEEELKKNKDSQSQEKLKTLEAIKKEFQNSFHHENTDSTPEIKKITNREAENK